MKKLKAESIAADLGNDAASEGKPRNSNPYPDNTSLRKWWDLGWLECEAENVEDDILDYVNNQPL